MLVVLPPVISPPKGMESYQKIIEPHREDFSITLQTSPGVNDGALLEAQLIYIKKVKYLDASRPSRLSGSWDSLSVENNFLSHNWLRDMPNEHRRLVDTPNP